MFLPDWQPITVDLPTEWEFAHLYFVHDLHYGSELFDERKWMRLKDRILSDKYGKVLFIGDLFENAIPGSKSDNVSILFTHTGKQRTIVQRVQSCSFGCSVAAMVSGNNRNGLFFQVNKLLRDKFLLFCRVCSLCEHIAL